MKLSIIIPCYNEDKTIKSLLKNILQINFPIEREIIVVDDGLASGFSMLVTVKTLRAKAGEVVVAVPTAPVNAIELISAYVDKVVCLNIRSGSFFAVADAYKEWYDLEDEDVINLLETIT